ncbi:apolipoprotein N-acyltransferase [Actinoallomurus bryophytorum]|uniref:Apolipoprotein N-acyltransferase n=1 Tax=Actinoallomurus bryophytorum TaxID=1490222 RepID=A0A543BTI7_9ACTN|nr:apolipoprotein N-acyltransferase [Actinoallomurus bryophytorum]TQL88142.1 apolipoprotein N-acyltransferase [Actinoallomurus bryophytorum]
MAQETLAEESPGVAERPSRRHVPARLRRPALAMIAGLLLAAAFPPIGWWPLAPVAAAMFALVLRGRRLRGATGLGMLFGLAFCFPLFEGLRPVGIDAWLALSVFEALYFALLGTGVALVTRLRAWPLWTALLWITEEFVRGRVPFGGFPWGRLAFSQTASPFTGYAPVGGAPLISFVTALTGGLLAAVALTLWRRRAETPSGSLRGVALMLAGVLVLGLGGILVPRPSSTGGRQVTVAVVQGNVPRAGLDFLGQREAVLDNHARETHVLASEVRAGKLAKPDIVIWPENSSDLDPYQDAQARQVIDAAVQDIGVPVLVGAVIDHGDGEHVENRGIVWDPVKGPGAYYVKRHPLPFGEYIPIFRGFLRKVITRFDMVGEFVKGRSPGSLQLGPVKIGDVICFEVAYDGLVRDVAQNPLLVVQTNNATFGRTSLPPQQFAMSRLRAVEHGRTMVVASTSGISGIITPSGRVLDHSKEFTPVLQVERVPLRTSRTLSDHLGAAPEWVLALLGFAAAAVAAARTRTSKGT